MGLGKRKDKLGVAHVQEKHHFHQGEHEGRNAHFWWCERRAMAAHKWSWGACGGCPRGENWMGIGGLNPHIERMSVCVGVCEGLALQASIKAWGGSLLTNEHNASFLLTMTSIYTKKVSLGSLALIPTLGSHFSLVVCVWLACAAGFLSEICFENYIESQ